MKNENLSTRAVQNPSRQVLPAENQKAQPRYTSSFRLVRERIASWS